MLKGRSWSEGATHTLTVELNPIATHVTAASRLQVQVLGGSLVFGVQRSAGAVALTRVDASLPLTRGSPSAP